MKCYNLRYVWVWYWSVAVVWRHIGACNIHQHTVTFHIIFEVPTAFSCHKNFQVTHITVFMKTVKIPPWNIQYKKVSEILDKSKILVLKYRDTEISFCAVVLTADRGKWSSLCSSSREKAPGTNGIWCFVGPNLVACHHYFHRKWCLVSGWFIFSSLLGLYSLCHFKCKTQNCHTTETLFISILNEAHYCTWFLNKANVHQ